MTNFRLGLTLSMIAAGLLLAGQPAFSSDIDDMLKKYPNPAAGTFQQDAISGKESTILNAIRQHVQKMYNMIGSATTAGKLTPDQAAVENQKVQAVEVSLRALEQSAIQRPADNYTFASTLFTYSDELSYGDLQQLVSQVGTAEADLGDILSKKQKRDSELASKTPPPKAPPAQRPSAAKPYRQNNPASNALY